MSDWLLRLLEDELARRRDSSSCRVLADCERCSPTHVRIDGRDCVNFSSNDYLGLATHPKMIRAASLAAQTYGVGAGASPLICGHTPVHTAAERALAGWKGTQAALLLPSGYQTAHAVVQTLAALRGSMQGGVRFLVDKLAHASLIDAVGGSGAAFRIFPHNQLEKLGRLLRTAPTQQLQIVVTESIFSMDGDAADLAGLLELRRKRPFVLVLDEAHASGVYGPAGAGYAAELGLQDEVDVTIVTLSKALGISGGAICASRAFCEAVVNFGRAYIYSTAVSPVIAAVIPQALTILREEPHRQHRVRELARRVRMHTPSSLPAAPADSPIVPFLLGSDRDALAAAAFLRQKGLLAWAIRPPTVPRGTSRLRITLSAEHTDEEVSQLLEGLNQLTAQQERPD